MSRAQGPALLLAVQCLLFGGCDDGPEAPVPCREATSEVTSSGIVIDAGCGRWSFLPRARIGDTWVAARDGSCEAAGDELRCPIDGAGSIAVALEGSSVTMWFEADQEVSIQGFALEGTLRLPGADSWLSNGFQSWSQSGVIAIGARRSEGAIAAALALRGDPETLRTGEELSNWYTWAGSMDGPALFLGATSADRFRPWFQVALGEGEGEGELWLRAACGGAGEVVEVAAGETVTSESFHLEIGDRLEPMLDRYAVELSTRREAIEVEPEAGWNSWYELWDDVDEEAVRANAALAREILEPALGRVEPLRIVVDDGWQLAWGEWEPNDKFPSGLDGLAGELRAEGFRMGVWLAPLLVSEASDLVANHPDWFVEDLSFNHVVNGPMRVLDPTHPEAAEHLQAFIAQIVGWGYDLLKIDFLFAGSYEGVRYEPVTGLEAYHRALGLIREAAGDEVILLAVGAPPLPSFPYVDAWRLGADIAFEPMGPSWYFVVNQARSLASRWPLCRVTLCDPDPLLLRDLGREEVGSAAWVVGLAGGGLFISDDLRQLDADRRTWGLDEAMISAVMSGHPSIPLDPFPADPPRNLTSHVTDMITGEDHHVLPARWHTPRGDEMRFNFAEEPLEVGDLTIPPRGARRLP